MGHVIEGALLALALFGSVVGMLELGRRTGAKRRARDAEAAQTSVSVVNGAVFGLLGLLIAFTFSGAAARFERRRDLIVEEANAVGTAWLRLDLLPADAQPPLRDSFRRYIDARLDGYRMLPDRRLRGPSSRPRRTRCSTSRRRAPRSRGCTRRS
jgi:hypothetical protein